MNERLVRVFASADATAGEMMRGRLEAEGVSAMLKGDGEGPYRAGPVYVWVSSEHEETARAIVAAVESGAYALDDDVEVDVVVPEGSAGDATLH